jgi:uridine kinase
MPGSSITSAYDDQVERVATLALQRQPTMGQTRLVAVDGPAGSGKTSFAGALHGLLTARRVVATVMHLDDVYEGWTGLDSALETRVTQQLLEPLAESQRARWQRYDWAAERFDGWEELVPPHLLVLEGCGSGARAYAAYLTVLVWVEAPRQARLARGIARDGERMRAHWLRWMRGEARHFQLNETRRRADLVVRT